MASGEDKDMSHMDGYDGPESSPGDPTVEFFKTGMLIAVIIGVLAIPIQSTWVLGIAAIVAIIVMVVSAIMILCRVISAIYKRLFH